MCVGVSGGSVFGLEVQRSGLKYLSCSSFPMFCFCFQLQNTDTQLVFVLVELLYDMGTNSLGLISDAFHVVVFYYTALAGWTGGPSEGKMAAQ